MKYFRRAVRYFLYLIMVAALLVVALIVAGFAKGDINSIFVNGWNSLWQIALVMAAFAALYPRIGYSTSSLYMPGDDAYVKSRVLEGMKTLGYKVEKEEDNCIYFRKTSVVAQFIKSGEDRLCFTRTMSGYDVEGLTKDVVRVIGRLEETDKQ